VCASHVSPTGNEKTSGADVSDPTAHKARLARAEKWVKEQWTKDATLADMLVEFEEFLMKCEAKRQSK